MFIYFTFDTKTMPAPYEIGSAGQYIRCPVLSGGLMCVAMRALVEWIVTESAATKWIVAHSAVIFADIVFRHQDHAVVLQR